MSLRELRLKRGLTQKQLADKLGYTRERSRYRDRRAAYRRRES